MGDNIGRQGFNQFPDFMRNLLNSVGTDPTFRDFMDQLPNLMGNNQNFSHQNFGNILSSLFNAMPNNRNSGNNRNGSNQNFGDILSFLSNMMPDNQNGGRPIDIEYSPKPAAGIKAIQNYTEVIDDNGGFNSAWDDRPLHDTRNNAESHRRNFVQPRGHSLDRNYFCNNTRYNSSRNWWDGDEEYTSRSRQNWASGNMPSGASSGWWNVPAPSGREGTTSMSPYRAANSGSRGAAHPYRRSASPYRRTARSATQSPGRNRARRYSRSPSPNANPYKGNGPNVSLGQGWNFNSSSVRYGSGYGRRSPSPANRSALNFNWWDLPPPSSSPQPRYDLD